MITVRRALANAAFGLLACTAAAATAAEHRETGVAIAGARPGEAQELRRVLAQLGSTRIRKIEFGSRRPGTGKHLDPDAVALTIHAGTTLRGEWEAAVLSHVYRSNVRRLHLRTVAAVAIDHESHATPHIPTPFANADLAQVRDAIGRTDVQIVELSKVAGAVVIRVETDNPSAFLADDSREALMPTGNELQRAVYFAVQNAHGDTVYAMSSVDGSIRLRARPALLRCGPVYVGGPMPIGGRPDPRIIPCPT